METKELHEYYKSYLDEVFSEEFKRDLLEVAVSTYGEEFREKFEANMKKIIVHPKFNIKKIKSEKSYYSDNSEIVFSPIEDSFLSDLPQIEAEKQKKINEAQKKLFEALKETLSDEEAMQLQNVIDNYKNELFGIDESLIEFYELFGNIDNTLDLDLNLRLLYNLIQKYKLNELNSKKDTEHENPHIKQYLETLKKIETDFNKDFRLNYSNYTELNDELSEVDLKDFDLSEEIAISSAGVCEFKNKNTGEMEYHIFIYPTNNKKLLLGQLAHEGLHALEYTEREVDGNKQVRTGFIEYDDEETNRLTSECIHVLILDLRIYPALKKMGYTIGDVTDYRVKINDGLQTFYETFETQILHSRCQEDLHELYDVVGKENFKSLVESQNNGEYENQLGIVADMEEYSRAHIPERIGKFTLPAQEQVTAKIAIYQELTYLIEKESGDLLHAN